MTKQKNSGNEIKPLPPELIAYRDFIIDAEQKSQDSYDKAVLSLSGGALGISIAFIKDIIGSKPFSMKLFLFFSWGLWGVSILCILFSYFFSIKALRKTRRQIDKGKIFDEKPGGKYSKLTDRLNIISGICFAIGVLLITVVVAANLD